MPRRNQTDVVAADGEEEVEPVPPSDFDDFDDPNDDLAEESPYEGREDPRISPEQRAREMRNQEGGVFDSSVERRFRRTPLGENPSVPTVLPPGESSGLSRPAPASPVHDDERAVFVPGVQAPDRIPAPDHGAAREESAGYYPVSPTEVAQFNMHPKGQEDTAPSGLAYVKEHVGETTDNESGTVMGEEVETPTDGFQQVEPEE